MQICKDKNALQNMGEFMETTEQTESTPRTLDHVVGGPYVFSLKDSFDESGKRTAGLKLMLDEWTIEAEKWAKQHYGDMETLFNKLMSIGCDSDETVDAALAVVVYKLTEHSRRRLDEVRGDLTAENYIRKNLTYRLLADLCNTLYGMIRDSIPFELLEDAKKKQRMAETQVNPVNPATRTKPKRNR